MGVSATFLFDYLKYLPKRYLKYLQNISYEITTTKLD